MSDKSTSSAFEQLVKAQDVGSRRFEIRVSLHWIVQASMEEIRQFQKEIKAAIDQATENAILVYEYEDLMTRERVWEFRPLEIDEKKD